MAKHVVICAQGTGVSMWDADAPQPYGVAMALDSNRCYPQPLGNYPASVVNPQMGESVQDGVNEIVRLLTDVYYPGCTKDGSGGAGSSIILLGYSQGAWVVSAFMANECHSPVGRCHQRWLGGDIVCVAVWGNPLRCPGYASGNQFAGWPMPAPLDGLTTGGIGGPEDLQPAVMACQNPHQRHYWGEFVNTLSTSARSIYEDCPVGPPAGQPSGAAINTAGPPWTNEPDEGMWSTQIFDLVQAWFPALFTFILKVVEIFGPGLLPHLIGIGEAVWNAGMFAAAGPNASHYTYQTGPIIAFVGLAANEVEPRG